MLSFTILLRIPNIYTYLQVNSGTIIARLGNFLIFVWLDYIFHIVIHELC